MWTIGIPSPVVINMLVFAGNPKFITLPQYYSYNISNMKDEIKRNLTRLKHKKKTKDWGCMKKKLKLRLSREINQIEWIAMGYLYIYKFPSCLQLYWCRSCCYCLSIWLVLKRNSLPFCFTSRSLVFSFWVDFEIKRKIIIIIFFKPLRVTQRLWALFFSLVVVRLRWCANRLVIV